MGAWYAIQTKARQEATAERHLVNQMFTTFFPQLRVKRVRGGRNQDVTEPLFPRYLFIKLDIEQQNISPIRSTRGVVRLVQQGTALVPVPSDLIRQLMLAQSDSAVEPKQLFEPGDKVAIIDGPMAGFTAIFESQNSQERVILLLNILGNETLVNVSAMQVAAGR